MTSISIDGLDVTGLRDPNTQTALASAHARKVRPLCRCQTPGIPMYVAATASGFVVKRMPGSGDRHAPDCTSWQPPPALSGLGQVAGDAISDNPDDGTTALRLGFSLSKTAGRAAPEPGTASEADSVATDGHKLTLRALLHYLWDEAGLSSWSPKMTGRRNWRIVSWHLRQAADNKTAKRQPLGRRLFVPEPFDVAHKAQQSSRRYAMWKSAQATPGKATPLLVACGEVKDIEQARFYHHLRLKHLPDAPLLLADDVHGRLLKRFEPELEGWAGDPDAHLIAIATFLVNTAGSAVVQQIAVMLTDAHWLPIESAAARVLVAAAVNEHRRFRVCLRYNLPADTPSAALVFSDTQTPTAAFLIEDLTAPPAATDEAESDSSSPDSANQRGVVQVPGMALWQWNTDQEMPPLPARHDWKGNRHDG